MRLRQAKKIFQKTNREELDYRPSTFHRAVVRIDKTQSARDDSRYFYDLMALIGVDGRAKIVSHYDPAAAFRMLMEPRSER